MHDDRLICDNTVYGIANPQAIAPVQTLRVRQRGITGHCEVFTSGIVLTQDSLVFGHKGLISLWLYNGEEYVLHESCNLFKEGGAVTQFKRALNSQTDLLCVVSDVNLYRIRVNQLNL